MDDPVVFNTYDPGAVRRDKLNKMSKQFADGVGEIGEVADRVADDAAATEQSRQEAEGFKNQAEVAATNAANDVRSELEDVRDETEGFRDETASIKSDFEQAFGGLSYLAPVEYASGIDIDSAVKTVEYDGEVYAPLPSEVPFTTSGTFEVDKFRLIQGVTTQQMASTAGGGFAANIGRNVIAVDSIADLLALPEGARRGDLLYLVTSYHAGWAVRVPYVGPTGGGQFCYVDSLTGQNNGGTVINGFVRVLPGNEINVYDFGVLPGDDATLKIQAAVDAAATLGVNNVIIPNGEYWINVARDNLGNVRRSYGVLVPSNVHIICNATLKAIPNAVEGGAVFAFSDAENASVTGGYYIGEKFEHTYIGSMEWGHCIAIYGMSKNIKIDGLDIQDFMGDGVYICSDGEADGGIDIINCDIRECRRHEITVVCGTNINIIGNKVTKLNPVRDGVANVTYGGLNIDLEPNSSNDLIKNVVIEDNTFVCVTNQSVRSDSRSRSIEGLVFRGNTVSGSRGSFGINGGYDVVVESNNLLESSGGEGYGIRFTGVARGRISNNRIKNHTRPISLADPGFDFPDGNSKITISNNDIGYSSDAIFIGGITLSSDSHEIVVNNNRIVREPGGTDEVVYSLIVLRGSDVVCRNNYIDGGNVGRGILAEATDSRFESNVVKNVARFLTLATTFSGSALNNTFITTVSRDFFVQVNAGASCSFKGNDFVALNDSSVSYCISTQTGDQSRVVFYGNDFSKSGGSKVNSIRDSVWFGNILSDGSVDGLTTPAP